MRETPGRTAPMSDHPTIVDGRFQGRDTNPAEALAACLHNSTGQGSKQPSSANSSWSPLWRDGEVWGEKRLQYSPSSASVVASPGRLPPQQEATSPLDEKAQARAIFSGVGIHVRTTLPRSRT